jgi:hypothetical protein
VIKLSKHEPIKEFEEYISKIAHELHLDKAEKEELEAEWKQHLYDHYASLVKNNSPKDEAIKTVIEQFGDIKMLKNDVNWTYPSASKQHIQKEMIIILLCIVASIIGPGLLINAHFQTYFIIAPMQALILAYPIYRFIINRVTQPLLSLIGFSLIYIFFIKLFSDLLVTPLTFELYLSQLFSLDWHRLSSSDGLFTYVTLHMLWYLVIVFQIFSKNSYVPLWKRVCTASFKYWAMLLVGVLLARAQSSAEMGVIFLNVFLLYGFFQAFISIPVLHLWKAKLAYLILKKTI